MGKFNADITKFVKTTKLSADLVVRRLALDGYRGVLMRSPVDTGRFRANWRITVGGAADLRTSGPRRTRSEKEHGAPPDAQEEKRAERILQGVKFGGRVLITNNLPYALRLEDGWSKQTNHQPGGILAATFEELKRQFGETVAKAAREARGKGGG